MPGFLSFLPFRIQHLMAWSAHETNGKSAHNNNLDIEEMNKYWKMEATECRNGARRQVVLYTQTREEWIELDSQRGKLPYILEAAISEARTLENGRLMVGMGEKARLLAKGAFMQACRANSSSADYGTFSGLRNLEETDSLPESDPLLTLGNGSPLVMNLWIQRDL